MTSFLVELNLLNFVIIQTLGNMIQWLQLENMSPVAFMTVTWMALNSQAMMINFNLLIQMMNLQYQSNLEARERNYYEKKKNPNPCHTHLHFNQSGLPGGPEDNIRFSLLEFTLWSQLVDPGYKVLT